MPRKYRITDTGFYHVINRGVERRVVFLEEEDYDSFIEILKFISNTYKITIHAYCLMNNHYHLLLETTQTNISQAIKYLNANYASYFNKKYKRSGHLWQGRFFSNYLFDEEHFWIVAKYIERNPIKANIVTKIEHYKYQSLFQYIHNQKHYELIKNSNICRMTIKEYLSFIDSDLSQDYLQKVYSEPKKIKDKNNSIIILTKRIEKFFEQDRDINRTQNANGAFTYGYSKAEIARFLGLTSSAVSKLLR